MLPTGRRSLQELGGYPGDSTTDSYPADQGPIALAPAPAVGGTLLEEFTR